MISHLIALLVGLLVGALIALNNKSKADAAKDKGKSLIDHLKGK